MDKHESNPLLLVEQLFMNSDTKTTKKLNQGSLEDLSSSRRKLQIFVRTSKARMRGISSFLEEKLKDFRIGLLVDSCDLGAAVPPYLHFHFLKNMRKR